MAGLRTFISTTRAAEIAKLVFLLSVGIAAAIFAVPFADGILSSASPAYLFLTVHVIIVVIWKLSDEKLPKKEEDNPQKATEVDLPLDSDESSPGSGESCVTEEGSGDRLSSPASVVSAPTEVEEECKNDTMDDTWSAIVLRKRETWDSAPRTEVAAEDDADGGRVIKKSETFKESAPADDEWNQRFEAFIKKNYDQIRLQKGSNGRHVDIIDHASP